ncbi:MAG TPA: hypothetical protein DF614_00930 [Methylococcaceae bacterium]|nr:hypothetical protein [Methylococcaceae bacterium]
MLLETLNAFSGRISSAIEQNDWVALSDVLTQRQAYLEALLRSSLSDEERQRVEEVLKSVQAMDRLFIAQVQFKKAELLKEFQLVAKGQKFIRAYDAVAA